MANTLVRLDSSEKRLHECRIELTAMEQRISDQQTALTALVANIRATRIQLTAAKKNPTTDLPARRLLERCLKGDQKQAAKLTLRLKAEQRRTAHPRSALRREGDRLQLQVEHLRKQVPRSTLQQYDLLVRSGREPVITIANQGYCTGCYLKLPAQLQYDIRRMQAVKACPSCQRLLYSTGEAEVTPAV
jgi:predicted  nucleic acid-binding Zn-ribbon protein